MPETNGVGPLGSFDQPGMEAQPAATPRDGDPSAANGSEAG